MGYALTSPTPIIDPFFKLCTENITGTERTTNGRNDITIGLLGVCRSLNIEGTRLIVSNNDFIFTQAAALENFARVPAKARSTINHVRFRIVGRYYAEKAGFKNFHYGLSGAHLNVVIQARPDGLCHNPYSGLEAYCWSQLTDFLKALVVFERKSTPKFYSNLLPSLQSMTIDLVNFADNGFPHRGSRFGNIIRQQLGGIVDELMVRFLQYH